MPYVKARGTRVRLPPPPPAFAKASAGKPAKDDFKRRKPQRHMLKGGLSIRTHMHYVYLIRSITEPEQTYIGYTADLRAHLKKHNAGGSPYLAKYKP